MLNYIFCFFLLIYFKPTVTSQASFPSQSEQTSALLYSAAQYRGQFCFKYQSAILTKELSCFEYVHHNLWHEYFCIELFCSEYAPAYFRMSELIILRTDWLGVDSKQMWSALSHSPKREVVNIWVCGKWTRELSSIWVSL